MNYFQLFSIIWGITMIGIRMLIHLIPEKWNEFEINKAYTEKRPQWVWVIAFISLLVVGVTWYKQMTADVKFSIILTILVTITLIKISQLLFNYNNFRKYVIKALKEDRRIIVRINITTTLIGIMLILLGVFIY